MYSFNKKHRRSLKNRWKPGYWDEPDRLNPYTAEAKMARRKDLRKIGGWYRCRSLNDDGVVIWARKCKRHRHRKTKPYERPTKT